MKPQTNKVLLQVILMIAMLMQGVVKLNAQWSQVGVFGNGGTIGTDYYNRLDCMVFDSKGILYGAGQLVNANNYRCVVKWNGTAWEELGGTNTSTFNSYIKSIVIDLNGNLYVSGEFTNSNKKCYVAKWDGTTWSELSGTNSSDFINSINSLTIDVNGNVYAAVSKGEYWNTKYSIAKWDGTTWGVLGGTEFASEIRNITTDSIGNIYASTNGSIQLQKWDGVSWSYLPNPTADGIGEISQLAVGKNNALYAAGRFDTLILSVDEFGNQYQSFQNRYYVTQWNGTSWSRMEGGDGDNGYFSNYTKGLVVDANGNIYTSCDNWSGYFNIFKWNGSAWSKVGDWAKLFNTTSINTLAINNNGILYAAGGYSFRSYVAKYLYQEDYNALVKFYNSTGGWNWTNKTNWLSDKPIDTWYGVGIANGRVTSLKLPSNNIEQYQDSNDKLLSIEGICDLSALQYLDLSDNYLRGFPNKLGSLSALTNLNMSSTKLNVSIPTEIGNLRALTNLNLSNTYITGAIPAEIGNLTILDTLDLSNTYLTGSIPIEIGNLRSLKKLDLSLNNYSEYNNSLDGSIPAEIGNLSALTHLNLFGRRNLKDRIPAEIGNLRALTSLNLSYTGLTGAIPAEIGNLTGLTSLSLYSNQLTSVPAEIGNLTGLTSLSLYSNQLTSIPTGIGNLTSLDTLDLRWNELTNIPTEIGNLRGLTYLDLTRNQLTSVPTEIGNLTRLTSLDLSGNQLTSVPTEIGNLTGLTSLSLYSNQLTSVPTEIGNLTSLTSLSLGSNQLTSVPAAIGNLTSLTSLSLGSNQLTSVPAAIGGLSALKDLWLSENQLTSIPAEIGNLTGLTSLGLSNNKLTSVPSEIGNLTSLTRLNLDNNQLIFNDLEKVAALPIQANEYAPQSSIPILQKNNKLYVKAGGTPSNNTYNWYNSAGNIVATIKGDSTFAPPISSEYHVNVTNSIATKLTLLSDTIAYTASPTPILSSFSPIAAAPGTIITIKGTNLSGVISVSFGGVAATSPTVLNDSTITAVVGSGASGSVSVTTSDGKATKAGFIFAVAPSISAFNPSNGCSGTSVNITGTNFTGATAVSFGGIDASSFIVNSSTSITAVVGSGSTGTVKVTTAVGTATSTNTYTFGSASNTTYAYVSNYYGDNVSVINTVTNTLTAKIPVGKFPIGVSVSPDGKKVYVVNNNSHNVSVINTATNKVTTTIQVRRLPTGVSFSPDGSRAYVANSLDNNVSVINTSTSSEIATIAVGDYPYGVTVSPDGTKAYVANFTSYTVSVINTATNTVSATVVVGSNPHGVCISPDGTKVYVACGSSNSVSVINTATNTVTATVAVGSYPYGISVSPDGTKVYVANQGSNNVSLINTTTNIVTATIAVGSYPSGVSVSPDGTKVYVVNTSSSNVSVINIATNTVTATMTVSGSPESLGNFIVNVPISPCTVAPTISSFTPISASTGETITIKGKTFTGTTAVTFGNIAASSFNFVNDSVIKAVIGNGASGSVSVTNAGGTDSKSGFNFGVVPNIISFTPATAIKGSTVTIAGTNLTGATYVSFGGTAASSYTVVNDSTITAVVGVGTTGSVTITTVSGGSATKAGFTFLTAPSITAFNPSNGSSGTTVNITGTNFTGATAVSFGGTNAASFTVNSATSITAVVGVGASGVVSVTNAFGVGNSNSTFNLCGNQLTYAYIANSNSANVSVISIDKDSTVATIPVGGSPQAVGISPTAAKVYVTNFDDGTVSIINTVSNVVTATITVGGNPLGVVVHPNSTKIYVANSTGEFISIIDALTNEVIAAVNLAPGSTPSALAISPDGTKLYVATSNAAIVVINTITNTISQTISVLDNVFNLSLSKDGSTLYATLTNSNSNFITVINTSTNTITKNVNINPTSQWYNPLLIGIAINNVKGEIYVTDANSNNIVVIDATTFNIKANITVKTPNGVSFSEDGLSAYVINYDNNTLSVINTDTRLITKVHNLESNPYTLGNFIANIINPCTIAPTINSFTPSIANIGATVTIKGKSFTGATEVSFGGTAATSYSIVNDSTITAIVGKGTSGSVSVTTSGGTATKTGFSYCTPVVTKTTKLEGCNSVLYNGITYTASTIVRDTVKSVGGCDSIYNVATISIAPITPTTENTILSDCSKVVYNGITYTTSTIVRDTVKSVGGCDSIYNVATIAITPITQTTVNTILSDCSKVLYNGITYTASTIVRDTIKSVGGCDSIYNVANITIAPITPTTVNTVLSDCSKVLYNGITYTISTTVRDTVKSVGGCDSIYNVATIAIAPITPTTVNTILSDCSKVLYNGITYTASTIVRDTIKSVGGCDSIYNVANITIAPITPTTVNTVLSDCSKVLYNGITYTISTTVRDTVKSVGGCDSIYNVATIAIAPITPTTVNTILSDCSKVVYNGITYTTSTIVRDTVKSVGGCDSIYNVATIAITPITQTTVKTVLSDCSKVLYNGITYTTSTIVRDTVKSVGGCDSIYNVATIAITPITPTTVNTVLSDCSKVLYNGITYTASSIVRDTVKSVGGCDSIYNVATISIAPITPTTVNTVFSDCSKVLYNGITYTTSTIVRDMVKSVGGCDSIYNVATIAITPITPTTVNTILSDCSKVFYNGITYTTSTIVRDTVKSVGGCDSIYNVANITIAPITPTTVNKVLSDCSKVVYNGITYTISTTVRDTIKSVGGCDSIYNVAAIAILSKPNLGVDKSVIKCVLESVDLTSLYKTTGLTASWNTFTPSNVDTGLYKLVVSDDNNCSDTAIVTIGNFPLTPNPSITPSGVVSIPNGGSVLLTSTSAIGYQWYLNGIAINAANTQNYEAKESGQYTIEITDTNGCRSKSIEGVTLPQTLLQFKVLLQSANALCSWVTNTGKNTSQFIVERSLDGGLFGAIGYVKARGITSGNTTATYAFTDTGIFKLNIPVLYYRLRRIDKDGSFELSEVVSIYLNKISVPFTLHPNPSHINVFITGIDLGRVRIFDNAGRLVYNQQFNIAGYNITKINIESLKSGIYWIQLTNKNGIPQTLKLVVK